jgi:serine/threonine protein phosphatase PrpC
MIEGILLLILFLVIVRVLIGDKEQPRENKKMEIGMASFIGTQEVQADYYQVIDTPAGIMSVLSDGIGKGARGKVSSRIATETFASLFKQYQVMSNPSYFFKRAFNTAHFEIVKILEGREGGASVIGAIIEGGKLYYALAGDIKIALFRKGELIPLSEGHTINILANKAFKQGKLTKQKTLAALKEKRLWNYVGRDGFKEIEFYDVPITLKYGDKIVLMTKGVYSSLPWKVLEEVLNDKEKSLQQQADGVMEKIMHLQSAETDNSTMLIVEVSGYVKKIGVEQ